MGLLSGTGISEVAPVPAARTILKKFHTARYLHALQNAQRGKWDVDALTMGIGTEDCPIFKGMYDYAVLAGHVLRHHGQNPRLIHVRMVGRVAHAVCYVTESKAYLDYNNRKYAINMERCGASLREIATQVADLIKPVFDVRRIRFGNPFRLEKEQDGTLLKFEYKIDDERVLKVKKKRR